MKKTLNLKASNRPKLTQTLGPTSPIVTESELHPDLNSKETVKEAQKDSNAWLAPSSNPITHDEWEKKHKEYPKPLSSTTKPKEAILSELLHSNSANAWADDDEMDYSAVPVFGDGIGVSGSVPSTPVIQDIEKGNEQESVKELKKSPEKKSLPPPPPVNPWSKNVQPIKSILRKESEEKVLPPPPPPPVIPSESKTSTHRTTFHEREWASSTPGEWEADQHHRGRQQHHIPQRTSNQDIRSSVDPTLSDTTNWRRSAPPPPTQYILERDRDVKPNRDFNHNSLPPRDPHNIPSTRGSSRSSHPDASLHASEPPLQQEPEMWRKQPPPPPPQRPLSALIPPSTATVPPLLRRRTSASPAEVTPPEEELSWRRREAPVAPTAFVPVKQRDRVKPSPNPSAGVLGTTGSRENAKMPEGSGKSPNVNASGLVSVKKEGCVDVGSSVKKDSPVVGAGSLKADKEVPPSKNVEVAWRKITKDVDGNELPRKVILKNEAAGASTVVAPIPVPVVEKSGKRATFTPVVKPDPHASDTNTAPVILKKRASEDDVGKYVKGKGVDRKEHVVTRVERDKNEASDGLLYHPNGKPLASMSLSVNDFDAVMKNIKAMMESKTSSAIEKVEENEMVEEKPSGEENEDTEEVLETANEAVQDEKSDIVIPDIQQEPPTPPLASASITKTPPLKSAALRQPHPPSFHAQPQQPRKHPHGTLVYPLPPQLWNPTHTFIHPAYMLGGPTVVYATPEQSFGHEGHPWATPFLLPIVSTTVKFMRK